MHNWEYTVSLQEPKIRSMLSKEKFGEAEVIKTHLKDFKEDSQLLDFFLFLIERDPFENSLDLLNDVQLFLNSNLTIIDEINLYLMALYPNNGKVCENILKYQEVIFMRTFMMFGIMKLQTLRFDSIENISRTLKHAVFICQQKWLKFASLFN